jgi:DNA-binding transcriptional LysR family regulator
VKLHVSQPSTLEQIRELEAAFGETLFRREGRGLTVTATRDAHAESKEALPHTEEPLARQGLAWVRSCTGAGK